MYTKLRTFMTFRPTQATLEIFLAIAGQWELENQAMILAVGN